MNMSIFDNLLSRYGYIRKEKIQDLLVTAREAERTRVEQEFEKRLARVEDELQEKHFLEMSSKESELKTAQKVIADLEKNMDDARKAYRNYKKDVKSVNKLVHDVIYHIKRLFDKSGEIYQNFASIQDEADQYLKKLEGDDDENRKLLGISH